MKVEIIDAKLDYHKLWPFLGNKKFPSYPKGTGKIANTFKRPQVIPNQYPNLKVLFLNDLIFKYQTCKAVKREELHTMQELN